MCADTLINFTGVEAEAGCPDGETDPSVHGVKVGMPRDYMLHGA
jgi:hypothetical protein